MKCLKTCQLKRQIRGSEHPRKRRKLSQGKNFINIFNENGRSYAFIFRDDVIFVWKVSAAGEKIIDLTDEPEPMEEESRKRKLEDTASQQEQEKETTLEPPPKRPRRVRRVPRRIRKVN